MNTQVENGMSKLFGLRGQTIYVSDQAIFILKYSGLHDKEGNKINIRKPLIENQRLLGQFLSFMMMVHPDQGDPKWKNSCMDCRA